MAASRSQRRQLSDRCPTLSNGQIVSCSASPLSENSSGTGDALQTAAAGTMANTTLRRSPSSNGVLTSLSKKSSFYQPRKQLHDVGDATLERSSTLSSTPARPTLKRSSTFVGRLFMRIRTTANISTGDSSCLSLSNGTTAALST